MNSIFGYFGHLKQIEALMKKQTDELQQLRGIVAEQNSVIKLVAEQNSLVRQLEILSPRMRRNFLPNDDSTLHKLLMNCWQRNCQEKIGYKELLESGFRVFSQNDEDGVLLRIFSQIGCTNRNVIEIGSNCSDSDIGVPENLSTNLIVNHGWHGLIIEIDDLECKRMQYFFARDFSTKHFHMSVGDTNSYYSPLIVQREVTPENINALIHESRVQAEPDLMAIDIDGGDYEIIRSLTSIRPRVLVVEFEKRFGNLHCVVQRDRRNFGKYWPQSGAASLPAWNKLMKEKGYTLCAIGTCGFNAFYVRSNIAKERFFPLDVDQAFTQHPILSSVNEDFWKIPDETWQLV